MVGFMNNFIDRLQFLWGLRGRESKKVTKARKVYARIDQVKCHKCGARGQEGQAPLTKDSKGYICMSCRKACRVNVWQRIDWKAWRRRYWESRRTARKQAAK